MIAVVEGRVSRLKRRESSPAHLASGIALILSLGLSPAEAQINRGLDQVTSVKLIVESLDDEDARRCSITQDAIDAAMRLPLSTSKLTVSNTAVPLLAAQVTVISLPNGTCAVAARLSFSRPFWPYESNDRRAVWGDTWQATELLTGSQASIGKRVADTMEGATKRFIAAWLKEQDGKR